MITINEALKSFPGRKISAHKGDFGHVLVIAGSSGYTGAAYLTAQAAVFSGGGLVTVAAGRSIYAILAGKLTEAMVRPFIETRDFSLSLMAEKELFAFAEKCDVAAVGPGISTNRETQALIRNFVSKFGKPIVLDADGLNAFVGHAGALKNAGGPLVLTPHPGELSRLSDTALDEIESSRKDVALKLSSMYNTVLVLKGHETIVASPNGDYYLNHTGNPGMASGGMGDVLTGMIAGFIGQKCDSFMAAILAVYFHGLAGDIAAKEKGFLSLRASDVLDKLPEVLKSLA